MKVAIIGSGFGGLSLGIRLLAKGFKVSIFEKNEKVGGHAYQLVKNGYVFDMGPSLITAPDIVRDVFESAGRKMEDYINLIPLNPYYRIYFSDGSYIDYTGNSNSMKEQMAKFNPSDALNYDKFMEVSKKMYHIVIDEGLGAVPFDKWSLMLKFIPRAIGLNAIFSSYNFAKKYFKDFRHRFVFSFHPLFIGGNPFRAPAIYQMIPYLEKEGGVWFTKGGMYSLVRAFEKLFLELGGEIYTSCEVESIQVENGRVKGVIANENFYPADIVVSNADFKHTYGKLLKNAKRNKWNDKRLEKVKYGMSCFLIYLGVKRKYPKLLHHTIIVSKRYKELVEDIFERHILPDDFSMYLHAPTRTDESMAPPGCESVYILVPVPNLKANVDWESYSYIYAKKILDYLERDFGLEDLQNSIEVMEIFTPLNFYKRRNNILGAPWGVEPRLNQTAIFRPHNRSEDIKGLYLVGANTHPGAGIPGVLLSAKATERAILEDLKLN
jgi:phytoene desaturase